MMAARPSSWQSICTQTPIRFAATFVSVHSTRNGAIKTSPVGLPTRQFHNAWANSSPEELRALATSLATSLIRLRANPSDSDSFGEDGGGGLNLRQTYHKSSATVKVPSNSKMCVCRNLEMLVETISDFMWPAPFPYLASEPFRGTYLQQLFSSPSPPRFCLGDLFRCEWLRVIDPSQPLLRWWTAKIFHFHL